LTGIRVVNGAPAEIRAARVQRCGSDTGLAMFMATGVNAPTEWPGDSGDASCDVQAATVYSCVVRENRHAAHGARWCRPYRRQPACAERRLGVQPAMRAAMVVTDVLAQDALCVSLIHDDHVVEAFPPKGSDHSFAIRIGLRCSRRRGETPRAEALHPAPEPGAVDRVAIVDEEARCLVVAVAHGFDEGLAAYCALGVDVTPTRRISRRQGRG